MPNLQTLAEQGIELDPPGLKNCGWDIRVSATPPRIFAIYVSSINKLECVGEDDCMNAEAGERELVLVVSARCSKERVMTRGLQNVLGTPMFAILSRSALSIACSRDEK